jgi:hypothetical protein
MNWFFVAIGEPRENLGQKADARGGLTERNAATQ